MSGLSKDAARIIEIYKHIRALFKTKGKIFHSFTNSNYPDVFPRYLLKTLLCFIRFLLLFKTGANSKDSGSVFSSIVTDYINLRVLLMSTQIHPKYKTIKTKN